MHAARASACLQTHAHQAKNGVYGNAGIHFNLPEENEPIYLSNARARPVFDQETKRRTNLP